MGLSRKALAPHSSTLAWRIPWLEEPGRLQSMGSLRVGHDWATSLSLFTLMHWTRKWQPTPVFLPEESQGLRSLVTTVYGVAQSRTRRKWLGGRLTLRSQQDCVPSGGSRENVFSCLFPVSQGGSHPWHAYIHLSIFKASNFGPSLSRAAVSLAFPFMLPSSVYKGSCDLIRTTHKIQNNLPISRSAN